MPELTDPLEAMGPIAAQLSDVRLLPLAIGVALQIARLLTLGGVWLRVLRAALPGTMIRRRDALVPYLVAAGVNAVVPARAGLATRAVLTRRRVPAAAYETIAGGVAAETLLAAIPLGLLVAVAAATGLLGRATGHAALRLPSWLAPGLWWWVGVALAVSLPAALAAHPSVRRRAGRAVARARQGMRVLAGWRTLVPALAGHLVAWALRIASVMFLLAAFGLPGTVQLAVLVVLAQSLAGLVPVSPGGAGTQQALIVVALGGAVSAGSALAFGVGLQAAILAADLIAGVGAVAVAGGWLVGRSAATAAPAPARGA